MTNERERAGGSLRTAGVSIGIAGLVLVAALLSAACGVFEKVTGPSTVVLNIQGEKTAVAPKASLNLTINAANEDGGPVDDGVKVKVELDSALGTLDAEKVTIVGGKAVVTFTAGSQLGKTVVKATTGKASAQYTISIEKAPPPGGGDPRDQLDITKVTFHHPSPAKFKVTARLSNIRISGLTIAWDWSQPGWPVEYSNGVLGNMWVFARIGGQWHAATWEWLRASTNRVTLEAKPGQPPFIQASASPIDSWYPKSGEEIAFMASTPCRSGISAGSPRERSPIIKTRWP
ncbi:MAG TPA: hypothetical protein VI078_02980 [bacterium]